MLLAASDPYSTAGFTVLFTILAFDAELQLDHVICQMGQCYLDLFHMYVIPSHSCSPITLI